MPKAKLLEIVASQDYSGMEIDLLRQQAPIRRNAAIQAAKQDYHAALTVRMSLRRFTRLTNGHSKSLRHHTAMQAYFVAWYNFSRKHAALGKNTTPAMASGPEVTTHGRSKRLIERAGEV